MGVVWTFFLSSAISFLSPSLWEPARYRLKYCLKGPINPKQPTNQLIVSQREGERMDECKNAVGPCPTVIQIVGRTGTGILPSAIAPPDHPRATRSTACNQGIPCSKIKNSCSKNQYSTIQLCTCVVCTAARDLLLL